MKTFGSYSNSRVRGINSYPLTSQFVCCNERCSRPTKTVEYQIVFIGGCPNDKLKQIQIFFGRIIRILWVLEIP